MRAMSVTETYTVTGMTCGHCVEAVTEELTKLPGVRAVHVDLNSGAVSVESDGQVPLDEVRAAVDEAGYALA
jgi:copper ion binding protein